MTDNTTEGGFIATIEKLLMKDNSPSFLIFGILLLIGILLVLLDKSCSYTINIGLILIIISVLFALIRIFTDFYKTSNSNHKAEIFRIDKTHQKHIKDLKEALNKPNSDVKGLENRVNQFLTIQNNTDNIS